jgi:hypothetical protein
MGYATPNENKEFHPAIWSAVGQEPRHTKPIYPAEFSLIIRQNLV